MSSSSSSRLRAVAAAAVFAAGLAVSAGAVAQETLRPEVGRPLQAAQELIKGGKYREALAKVRDAEAAGARNANETYLIERMRRRDGSEVVRGVERLEPHLGAREAAHDRIDRRQLLPRPAVRQGDAVEPALSARGRHERRDPDDADPEP